MDTKFPVVRREGIFSKIKKLINRILGREEIIVEPVQEYTKKDIEQIKGNSFREGLKVKSKDVILFLQRQLEEKKIEISDLTDEQLDEMIELYETQIEEKKQILKQKDNIIKQYKNKKEE